MLSTLVPILLRQAVNEALKAFLLFEFWLHVSGGRVLGVDLVFPPFEIVKGPRYGLDLERIHEAERVRANHIVQYVEGAATVDSFGDQVSFNDELAPSVGHHLEALTRATSLVVFKLRGYILVGLNHLVEHQTECVRGEGALKLDVDWVQEVGVRFLRVGLETTLAEGQFTG